MRVLVLNGPNLDRLGNREPDVYGGQTLAELEARVVEAGSTFGVEVATVQSNHAGELIDMINGCEADGIVINPGALAHTSRALADSIRSASCPAVEVHLSNVREREPWRATSVVAEACVRSIYGRGSVGYEHALRHLVNRSKQPVETLRYGPHPENVADHSDGTGGMVMLVHGGFWRQEWERDTTESLAVDLTERGMTTWNIEYRRIGTGGGWPGSAHDVLTALDFLSLDSPESAPVSIVGHSAGAALALWAAARTLTEVAFVVCLAPVIDLELHAGSGLFGAAEAALLLESGAPARFAPTVPTLAAHGRGDELVPIEHSRLMAHGDEVDFIEADGGHFELLDPAKSPWRSIVKRMVG